MELAQLEETLKYYLDRYGEIADQKALMESDKQMLINGILTPQQKADIESIEEEFAGKKLAVAANEKEARRQLDRVLKDYADKVELMKNEKRLVKSTFAKVSIEGGDAEYDTASLDGYAVSHPEILGFRNEGKKKTRVTLNKEITYVKA